MKWILICDGNTYVVLDNEITAAAGIVNFMFILTVSAMLKHAEKKYSCTDAKDKTASILLACLSTHTPKILIELNYFSHYMNGN